MRSGPVVRPIATYSIIAANVLWFVLVELPRGLDVEGLLASGACAPALVYHGEWFREWSAMFVHASTMHIALNMISLWSLRVVELWIGPAWYVTTYLLSGFAGFLLTTVVTDPMTISVGASGAVFGIFGVALYMALRGILGKNARNSMIALLAVNLIFDVMSPGISLSGHLGGLMSGILAMALLHKRFIPLRLGKWLAGGCTLIAVSSLFLAYLG